MIPGFTWRVPEDECDSKMLDDVRKFGWHVVGILGDDEGPPYSFSVGLYLTFGHPEIVVMGMDHEAAQQTINRIGALIQSGNLFVPERRYENT